MIVKSCKFTRYQLSWFNHPMLHGCCPEIGSKICWTCLDVHWSYIAIAGIQSQIYSSRLCFLCTHGRRSCYTKGSSTRDLPQLHSHLDPFRFSSDYTSNHHEKTIGRALWSACRHRLISVLSIFPVLSMSFLLCF